MSDESMRERFEAWLKSCNCDPLYQHTVDAMFSAWQAATLAERERAAKVCDSLTVALDNGGNEYLREASASACAEAIRKGES